MKLLGATVVPVHQRLEDAEGRAQRSDARLGRPTCTTPSTSSAPSPAPIRIRAWCATSTPWSAAKRARRCWPSTAACRTSVTACVGGGSNAIGIFHAFLNDRRRAHRRRRSGGRGHRHAATTPHRWPPAAPACCTATAPTCCATTTARSSRRIRSRPASTIPGVGPEHAFLKDTGRARVRGRHRRRSAGGLPPARAHRGHPRRRSNPATPSRRR